MNSPLLLLTWALLLLGIGAWLFWPERGLFWRRQRARALGERILLEDALKHIQQCEYEGRHPTIQSIAGALQQSVEAMTPLLTTMQARELVTLMDGELRLTPQGHDYALHIIRAHRLWESYLADKTGYSAADWHSQSERREHELSRAETAALSAELGHPRFDPHGDPIPTAGGELIATRDWQTLAALPLNQPARIVHLEDEPATIYAQLLAEGLHLGMQIIVTDRTEQRIRFWGDGDDHVLAPLLATNISVVPVHQEEVESAAFAPLSHLALGKSATVLRISQRCQGAERRRLLDLGILPGTTIKAEMVSPSGDPTAYRVRGALIGLRKEQAELIHIVQGVLPEEQTNLSSRQPVMTPVGPLENANGSSTEQTKKEKAIA
ncbi:MAG: metal-dependent transcriptional regulator [Caldilineaceae bacterium]